MTMKEWLTELVIPAVVATVVFLLIVHMFSCISKAAKWLRSLFKDDNT